MNQAGRKLWPCAMNPGEKIKTNEKNSLSDF